jgi:uncharacterized protein
LDEVRRQLGVPILTDVHDESQVAEVASVVDVLQTPAFLCRQTDFIRAVAQSGAPDQLWLDLKASLMLPMQCQRCLNPVLEAVQAERSFLFVADEAAAQALDDEVEDDVLVISRDFDALALVEDELILSLPLVPLHELCPESLPMSVADPAFEAAAERPNPFGVLASLKTDPGR